MMKILEVKGFVLRNVVVRCHIYIFFYLGTKFRCLTKGFCKGSGMKVGRGIMAYLFTALGKAKLKCLEIDGQACAG